MSDNNDEIHIEDDDARAAVTNTGMRWVLGIGLFLAIAILSLIWITGAWLSAPADETPKRIQGAAAETG